MASLDPDDIYICESYKKATDATSYKNVCKFRSDCRIFDVWWKHSPVSIGNGIHTFKHAVLRSFLAVGLNKLLKNWRSGGDSRRRATHRDDLGMVTWASDMPIAPHVEYTFGIRRIFFSSHQTKISPLHLWYLPLFWDGGDTQMC